MIIHSRKREMISLSKEKGKKPTPPTQPIVEKPRYKVVSVVEEKPEVKNEEINEDINSEEE